MGGVNFLDTILKKVESGARDFSVVNDQVARPAYAADVARAIRQLVEKRVTGVVHFANAGEATWPSRLGGDRARGPHGSPREGGFDVGNSPARAAPPLVGPRHVALRRLTGCAPRSWREALGDYLAERHASAPARPVP